jgi:hypothetical protein
MERFCARTLPVPELTSIAEHLASCKPCRQLFQETFQLKRGNAAVSFTLAPENWLRHEHLDYEQLVPYVVDSLGDDEREIIDIHLRLCGECREGVHSFQAYLQQTASELASVHVSAGRPAWREKLLSGWNWLTVGWKPIYATAIIVALVSTIILLALLLERDKTSNQQARQLQSEQSREAVPPVSPSTLPNPASGNNDEAAVIKPDTNANSARKIEDSIRPNTTRPSRPSQKVIPEPLQSSVNESVALNDGQDKVVIDNSGNLSGLDNLPLKIKQSVKGVLLAQNIERPTVLSEIAGEASSLRGTVAVGPSFKLLSPARTVIANDRPTFNWTSVVGATSYRVQVVDSNNREVANSGELPSTSTQWTLMKPLARGIVYTWVVTAVVNGQDMITPSASEPEMRFKVLDEATLREINALQQRTRSHLALGILYARAGLRVEAEREFQTLVKQNPNSTVARQLLSNIQSWR